MQETKIVRSEFRVRPCAQNADKWLGMYMYMYILLLDRIIL